MATVRRSVSVWVYAGPPWRVLLLRRPESRAAGWQPVTGRVEADDATLEEACAREIGEETGLPPPAIVEDLALESEFTGYDGATYRQRSFAARYDHEAEPRPSHEHEEARWVGLDEARAMLRWDDDRASLEALERQIAASQR